MINEKTSIYLNTLYGSHFGGARKTIKFHVVKHFMIFIVGYRSKLIDNEKLYSKTLKLETETSM